MRLQKIGERVGIRVNPKAKPLFDLAAPFSGLLQQIESGAYNQAAGAVLLYKPLSDTSRNAETVIDQYTLATGRDLKSQPVTMVSRAASTVVSGNGSAQGRPTPPQLPPRRPERQIAGGR